MKVLVLGHTGMLGDAVYRYFERQGYELETLPAGCRWPSAEMQRLFINSTASWIINCIGAIPQRKPQDHEYFELNSRLPFFLCSVSSKKIIHASTDCEFSGKIPPEAFYQEDDYLDATDLYGISKAIPAEFIKQSGLTHVKMIRASIVGIEAGTSFSLLNWFLSATDKKENITGFTNQYWNGITTLEWARVADSIIRTNSESVLYQIASQKVSKYQLLSIMTDVFRPGYPVKQAEHSKYHNKCLASKWPVRDIAILLKQLREFYGLQDV